METETILQQLYSFAESKDSELYKKAKIILDSIRETLQSKGMMEEKTLGTALFASLFSMIQQDIAKNNIEQEEPKLLLFNQLLTKINIAIVVKFYNQLLDTIFKLLDQQSRTQLSQKFALGILVELLQTQSIINQANPALLKLIENILNDQVAARKQSWNGLNTLLNQKLSSKFAIGTAITKFVSDILQNSQDDNNCMIITQFLNHSVAFLPINNVNDISFSLLKRLQLQTNESLEILIYLQFENIMKLRQLGFDNCETLLKEFLNTQPSLHSDEKVVMSYCQCLTQTLILMNELNFKEAKKYIPTAISVLQEVVLSDNIKLSIVGQKQLEALIIATIDEHLWKKQQPANLSEFDFDGLSNLGVDSSIQDKTFEKIISMLAHLLSSRFERRHMQVHGILGVFFQKIDVSCMDAIEAILKELVDSRLDRHPSSFEKCMAKLISKIGAGAIVKRFPLKLSGLDPLSPEFEGQSNFWMLPLFLKYTRNQTIEDYTEHFIPHISTITNGMNVYSKTMNAQEKVMFGVFLQLWECFGKFYIVAGQKGFAAFDLIIDNIQGQLSEENPQFQSVLRGLDNCYRFLSQTRKIPESTMNRSKKIIMSMHGLLMPGKASSKPILSVISHAAFAAPKEYLNAAFTSNSEKLLKLKDNDEIKMKLNSIIKTFDMLLTVSTSMDFKNDRWGKAMQLVDKFIKSQTVMQKKAYKFLHNIMSKVHFTFLPEVAEIIQKNEATSSSARPMRLLVIAQLWTLSKYDSEENQDVASIGEFLKAFLPELIIGLRDSNTRSRKASQDLFKKITSKMLALGMLNDFISLVSAGLGAPSSLMKADSVVAISFLLEKFGKSIETSFIKEVNSLILLLLKEQNKEIFKAILVYLKKYMKIIQKSELKTELPDILDSVFSADQIIRDKYRSLTKQILSRLIRKFTRPVIENLIPEAHVRLVRGILKEERYQKNKKIKERNQKKIEAKQRFQETDYDTQVKMEEEKQSKMKDEKNLLLKFDSEQATFHFVPNTGLKKMKDKLEEENERKEVEYVKGKIVVREAIEELTGKKRRREDRYATYDSILQEEREINENEKTVNTRTLTKKRGENKNNLVHNVQESGDTFKAKGETGGDVVRKGKPDPYAFIQLNPKALNKRHQKRASKAFDVVMNQKDKGALKGLKTNKKIKSQ